MREVWNFVGECGVYAKIGDGMELIAICPSIQSARNYVRDNWVDGEGIYVIVDHTTGKILCYFEDEDYEADGIVCDLSNCTKDELDEFFDLFFGGEN